MRHQRILQQLPDSRYSTERNGSKTMKVEKNKANRGKKVSEWTHFRKNLPMTLLTLPTILIMFVFNYIPLYGLILPFKKFSVTKGIIKSPWCGLKNFEFLTKSKTIIKAIENTVLYNFTFIFLGALLSLVIALMLYELGKRSVKVYQTSLLLPYFMSWVVVAYIVNALLDMDNGLLNALIVRLGGEKIFWYNDPKYWRPILIIVNLWKGMGYTAIVYFAALMGIDSSYFEAARIDGAGKLAQIWYISIPLIRNIILTLIILNLGKIFYGDFGLFYNVPMDSAALYDATDVVDTYVYRSLMNLGNVGMSATTGFCQSVLGFFLVLITNIAVKRFDSDSALF